MKLISYIPDRNNIIYPIYSDCINLITYYNYNNIDDSLIKKYFNIQIDLALYFKWPKKNIIIYSNISHEYKDIKTLQIPLNNNIINAKDNLFNTMWKHYGILHCLKTFNKNIYSHDHDSFQVDNFNWDIYGTTKDFHLVYPKYIYDLNLLNKKILSTQNYFINYSNDIIDKYQSFIEYAEKEGSNNNKYDGDEDILVDYVDKYPSKINIEYLPLKYQMNLDFKCKKETTRNIIFNWYKNNNEMPIKVYHFKIDNNILLDIFKSHNNETINNIFKYNIT